MKTPALPTSQHTHRQPQFLEALAFGTPTPPPKVETVSRLPYGDTDARSHRELALPAWAWPLHDEGLQ